MIDLMPAPAPHLNSTMFRPGAVTLHPFRAPYGVAFDAAGRLVVAEAMGQRGHVIEADGEPAQRWSHDRLTPYAVAAGPDGAIWIADSHLGRVAAFTPSGHQIASVGDFVGLCEPHGIAIGRKGEIAVTDTGNDRVIVFSPNGEVMRILGERLPGLLHGPRGVAFDAQGSVLVVDRNGRRIVRFGPEWDDPESIDLLIVPGSPSYPWGIAVDHRGRLLVTLTGANRVLVLSPAGLLLESWGSARDGLGDLVYPSSIAVSPDGRVAIADTYNDRVVLTRLAQG